jgi:dihydroorotase
VPVAAETIALHTIFELVRPQAHGCTCAASAVRPAWRWCVRPRRRAAHHLRCQHQLLHLTDVDMGYFDSRMRLNPPLRQQRDRDALRQALADGTIDALVSDHTPVDEDAKACRLPRQSRAPPGWNCCSA